MNGRISRLFCLWLAVLTLFAAVGLWAICDGERAYRERPLVMDFARGRAKERAE